MNPIATLQPVVGVVDVGSPKNIGWSIVSSEHTLKGSNLDQFVARFASLAANRPGLLGFEAPLFVPFGRPLNRITGRRAGERNRPWSAGAGATVTAIALAVVPHVLRELRTQLPAKQAIVDWNQPLKTDSLLLFEAFVSGRQKPSQGSHQEDAYLVAKKVADAYPRLKDLNCMEEDLVFSLIEACLVRTGWISAVCGGLRYPCMVVRP